MAAHKSLDSNVETSTMASNHLQEQIEALKAELEAKDEAIFDLNMTLTSVEAETKHKITQVQAASQQQLSSLQEQLRRATQEANLARSQANSYKAKLKNETILHENTNRPAVVTVTKSAPPAPPATVLPSASATTSAPKRAPPPPKSLAQHLQMLHTVHFPSDASDMDVVWCLVERMVHAWRLSSSTKVQTTAEKDSVFDLQLLQDALYLCPKACQSIACACEDEGTVGSTGRPRRTCLRNQQHHHTDMAASFLQRQLAVEFVQTLGSRNDMIALRIAFLLLQNCPPSMASTMDKLLDGSGKVVCLEQVIDRLVPKDATRRLVDEVTTPPSINDTAVAPQDQRDSLLERMAELLKLLQAMNKLLYDPQRSRRIVARILDVMELCIIPNRLHANEATRAIVSYLESLAIPNLTLLRTQMASTESTTETWHRLGSAIGVVVLLFHSVVMQQETGGVMAELDPIQCNLVRFFHSVLRVCQYERRQNDKPSVSFLGLLNECSELYLAAATSLLHTDVRYCSTENKSLLRLQMDELLVDEEEWHQRHVEK